MMSEPRPITILMAEDDENDAILAKEAMRSDKITNELYVVPNGLEALHFLRKEDCQITLTSEGIVVPSTPQEFPHVDLILLDLSMPIMDGREFLANVKQDATLRRIPVVVFTSSDNESDAQEAWDLGAATYVVKPINLTEFKRIVQHLTEYWVQIVRFEGRPTV